MDAGNEFKEYCYILYRQVFEQILNVVFKWQKELGKNKEKVKQGETHLKCFIPLVTSVTAGDVFDGETDDGGEKGGI